MLIIKKKFLSSIFNKTSFSSFNISKSLKNMKDELQPLKKESMVFFLKKK